MPSMVLVPRSLQGRWSRRIRIIWKAIVKSLRGWPHAPCSFLWPLGVRTGAVVLGSQLRVAGDSGRNCLDERPAQPLVGLLDVLAVNGWSFSPLTRLSNRRLCQAQRRSASLRAKCPTHLFEKKCWLFKRRKMTALIQFVPIKQIRPYRFGPGLGRAEDLTGEN